MPVELALRSGAPKRHCVRVLEFIPGEMMNEQHVTPALLREAGGYLGRLDAALDGFDAPGFHRDHAWDIKNTLGLRAFTSCLSGEEPWRAALVEARKSYRAGPKNLSWSSILTENPYEWPQVGITSGPTL